MENFTRWSITDGENLLESNQVHIYLVNLDVSTEKLERLWESLSKEEQDRASRFHFKKDQNRFVATRGILRLILGKYLDMRAQQIRFNYNSYGKPLLMNEIDQQILKFNLSHSDQFALYGFSKHLDIGIDIERIRDDLDVDQITRRFFSPTEIEILKSVDENIRCKLFFQYWTRKEAIIKAVGRGISIPLEEVDVSTIRQLGWSSNSVNGTVNRTSRWFLQDLFPCPEYVAAIAVDEDNFDLCCRYYFH